MASTTNHFATIACRDTTAMYHYLSTTLGALPGVQRNTTSA